MPDGSTVRTIGEAAEYATSLPTKIGNAEPWQLAARVLHEAAEARRTVRIHGADRLLQSRAWRGIAADR